jgi:hypothetical protein
VSFWEGETVMRDAFGDVVFDDLEMGMLYVVTGGLLEVSCSSFFRRGVVVVCEDYCVWIFGGWQEKVVAVAFEVLLCCDKRRDLRSAEMRHAIV